MSASDDAARELFGRGSIYTVATVVQLSSGLLVLPVATRLLGPEQFGAVAAALVIIQLLTIIAGLGMPGAVSRSYFLPDLGEDAPRKLIGAVLIAAGSATLVAVATSPLWVRLFDQFRGWNLVLPAAAVAGLLAVVRACQALLRARSQAWHFAAVVALAAVGGQVLGLTLAYLIRPEASWFLIGVAAGSLLGATLGLAMTGARMPSQPLVRWGLVLGFPTVPHSLALYVMQAGDRLVVERVLGLAAVGAYHVAYVIGALGAIFVGAVNNAWAPIIYQAADDDEREAVLVHTSQLVHRLAAFLAVGIALLSPIALRVAAPVDFGPADELILVVSAVALSTMPQVTYLSQVHLLFQHQRTRPLMIITPIVATVNVALNLLLVPRYGLLAAALTTFLAYALQADLIRRARRRLAGVNWDIRSQSISYVLAAAGCLLGGLLPADPVGLAIRVALAVLVGFYVLRVLSQLWRRSARPV